jgi:hypothetical protein
MLVWRITLSKDNKINAIKDLKDHFCLGLLESKNAVDLGLFIIASTVPHEYETENVKVFQEEMNDKEVLKILVTDVREKIGLLNYSIERDISRIDTSLKIIDSIMKKE